MGKEETSRGTTVFINYRVRIPKYDIALKVRPKRLASYKGVTEISSNKMSQSKLYERIAIATRSQVATVEEMVNSTSKSFQASAIQVELFSMKFSSSSSLDPD